MERGARQPAPCELRPAASCTIVRPDAGAQERCFGDAGNCARYRAMITGRNLPSTPCEPRSP
jgi:hypothetical protein